MFNWRPRLIPGAFTRFHIFENTSFVFDFRAIDDRSREGDGLTYSITGGNDANLFEIDAATGVLRFKAAPDFERPQDSNRNNIYSVRVRVTDAQGAFDDDGYTIRVLNRREPFNRRPRLIPGAGRRFFVQENTPFVFDFRTFDDRSREGDGITYSITGGNDANLFEIDAVTGELSFKEAPDFEAPQDSNRNNIYSIRIRVTDAQGAFDDDGYTIRVLDQVNEGPPAVAITSNGGGDTAALTLDEGQQVVTDLEVNLGDDNVVYFINDGADQDLFRLDSVTGELSFINAPDWENPQDANGDNVYEVNVVAAGATSGDSQFLTVSVADVENPDPTPTAPSLDITNTDNVVFVQEGKRYVTDININGAEEDVIYSLNAGADAHLFNIDSATGVLSFKQTPDWETPLDGSTQGATPLDNNYEVNVLAVRGNEADTQFLTITVTDVIDETAAPIPVYLLAGQSNLQGEAETANLSDPSLLAPFPQSQIWNNTQGAFVDLALGFDGQTLNMGTEFGFGRRAANLTNDTVYLVKFARGATSLAEDWNPDGTGAQYNQFVQTVDDALTGLATSGVAYTVAGLVWQQGESDTYVNQSAVAYEDNLAHFIDRVRELYGETLPVSIGQLRSDLPTSPNNLALVRAAQQAVADTTLGVSLLNTDALGIASEVLRTAQNDLTHYSADGQIILGQAHAEALI
ncbi:MAG: sialate O-acetylesterase [Cyanobacteria bacterium J06632_22]